MRAMFEINYGMRRYSISVDLDDAKNIWIENEAEEGMTTTDEKLFECLAAFWEREF